MIENLLNKKVIISMLVSRIDNLYIKYKGIVTFVDDEFIHLNNETYVAKKYILSIIVK